MHNKFNGIQKSIYKVKNIALFINLSQVNYVLAYPVQHLENMNHIMIKISF